MGYIYKITNIVTKKAYIGETIQDVNKRWNTHKNLAKLNKGCPALKEALNKYGIENFKFEVLIICFDEDRLIYEKEYITKYNTIAPNGYNISEGGCERGFTGLKHTDEAKQKISKASKLQQSSLEKRKEKKCLNE
jgi:group I intron endonuclease